MKTIKCPKCGEELRFNYMLFSMHVITHQINYAWHRKMWNEARLKQGV